MRQRGFHWSLLMVFAACWVHFGPGPSRSHGQAPIRGRAKGFRSSETDAQGRKVTIQGQTYRPRADGRMEFTGMVIESLKGTNGGMIIQAAESLVDPKEKVAVSTNAITVRAGNDRLAIDGIGFRYQWSDSRLTISNDVHTMIRRTSPATLTGPVPTLSTNAGSGVVPIGPRQATNKPPTKTEPIDIHSDQFDYVSDVATFRGNVRAKDEDGNLTCRTLKALFDASGNNVQTIEAEQDVFFERGDTQTKADKAVYLMTEDRVTLTGHPTWKTGTSEGSGDRIVMNNKTKEFLVENDVAVKFPQRAMLPLDWFSAPASATAAAQSNQWVQVQADHLRYYPTGAVFQGRVRLRDPQGAELKCGALTNTFSGPEGKLIGIVVQDKVEFTQGETIVRGDRATYATNAEFITLTGNPAWTTKQGEGRSDILFLDPKTKQLHAEQNVSMKLFQSGLNALDFSVRAGGTNALVRTNQEFTITADELHYRTGSAIFLHQVRVVSSGTNRQEIASEVLAAFFTGPENKLDQLVAEENVQIQQGNLRATGNKLVYFVTKGIVDLTGRPQITTPGRRYTGDHIVLDRTNNTFRIIGRYKIEVEQAALGGEGGERLNPRPHVAKKTRSKR